MIRVLTNDNGRDRLHAENLERLLNLINEYSDIIDISTNRRNGISAWFKAYHSSEAFKRLPEIEKEQALEVALDLQFVLKEINDIFCAGLPDASIEN